MPQTGHGQCACTSDGRREHALAMEQEYIMLSCPGERLFPIINAVTLSVGQKLDFKTIQN